MKDKSRFVSSVIVSLLAGFIYLLSLENVPLNIQSSVKGILSYNEPEKYLTTDYFPFHEISKNSGPKFQKNKTAFYLSKKKSGDKELTQSVSVKQASFEKALPDRNIDFTSELEKLIKNKSENYSDTYSNQSVNSGKNKILSCNENQIADAERNFKRTEKISKEYIEFNLKYDEGNGFYYNFLTDEIAPGKDDCEIQIINSNSVETGSVSDFKTNVNSNCNKNFNVKWNHTADQDNQRNKKVVVKTDKIKIKVKKIVVRTNDKDCNEKQDSEYESPEDEENLESYEINSNENSEEDTM